MAKTGGRDFKPGQSGNPKGPPGLPAYIRDMRSMDHKRFIQISNRFLGMTAQEILERIQDPNTTADELLVGSILHKAIIFGDHKRFGFFLDRLIGPVQIRVKSDVPDESGLKHSAILEFIEAMRKESV